MRILSTAAVLLLSLLLRTSVADDPKKEPDPAAATGTKLPFNPFKNAVKSDLAQVYETLKVRAGSDSKTVLNSYGTIVESVEGDEVKVTKMWKDQRTGNVLGQHFTFSKTEMPTVEEFLTLIGVPWPPTKGVKIEDEKRSAGGREWDCKKISYDSEKDGTVFHVKVWLSPLTRAGGIIGGTVEHEGQVKVGADDKLMRISKKFVLAGYGGSGKLEWGKTPAQVTSETKVWGEDPTSVPKEILIEDAPVNDETSTHAPASGTNSTDSTRLPFNPFAKAVKGDWVTFYESLRVKAGTEVRTQLFDYTILVDSVDKGKVNVVKIRKDLQGEVHTWNLIFSTKEAPTVAEFAPLVGHDGSRVKSVVVADDKREVGGTELVCKKLSFEVESKDNETSVTVWLSPLVKAAGIVVSRTELKGEVGTGTPQGFKTDVRVKLSVAGYGAVEKLDWGKSTRDVAQDVKRWNKDPDATPKELLAGD